jgi:hypothetical protein
MDSEKIKWAGRITAVQPRTRVWRYVSDNRTHYHTGYNLFLTGDQGAFSVAISEKQQQKMAFRIGDLATGTAWTKKHPKREAADYYRAGALKVVERADEMDSTSEPWIACVPALAVYEARGARMLATARWRGKCHGCIWANKASVEIQWCFDKDIKRYRLETFCYGPKSCSHYAMGKPRNVPYRGGRSGVDDGCLDDIITDHRGWDD